MSQLKAYCDYQWYQNGIPYKESSQVLVSLTCFAIRVHTHNAIKAFIGHIFGSIVGGCIWCRYTKINSRTACDIWNANKKLGQATAYDAIDRAIELSDKYGIGQVSVDNAFHYLWGGSYVMEAAKRGYIAYTNCTSALAEVVPFSKYPTLGTNPHSWGFPTSDAVGFPIVVDWATSVIAMGRCSNFNAKAGTTNKRRHR